MFIISINFFGLSMLSKKSKSEERIKDLALSWDNGTITAFNNKLKSTKKNESFIKKLIKLILLKLLKIINLKQTLII